MEGVGTTSEFPQRRRPEAEDLPDLEAKRDAAREALLKAGEGAENEPAARESSDSYYELLAS